MFSEALAATAASDGVADLSHLGVLSIAGADARTFLHGQVTADVAGLAGDASTLGAYCSAKGRMLASFRLWQAEDRYLMVLSRSLVPAIEKRLRMFVLRSRVTIADDTARVVLLGAAGPGAADAVRALGTAPVETHRVAPLPGGHAIRLPGERFLIAVGQDAAEATRQSLAARLRRADPSWWEWLDIAQGEPLVTAATQDEFVPQMVNLELIGGVSFTKGCYPGQEIVARTQYLGKSKRRMFLAHVDAEAAAGDTLFAEDLGDQASGTVVNAAPAPGGGCDLLAVVHAASAAGSAVRLRSLSGPALAFRPLPYAVP